MLKCRVPYFATSLYYYQKRLLWKNPTSPRGLRHTLLLLLPSFPTKQENSSPRLSPRRHHAPAVPRNGELQSQNPLRRQRDRESPIRRDDGQGGEILKIDLVRGLHAVDDLATTTTTGQLHPNNLLGDVAVDENGRVYPVRIACGDGNGAVWQQRVGDIEPHGAGAEEVCEVLEDPEALGKVESVILGGGVRGVDVEQAVVEGGGDGRVGKGSGAAGDLRGRTRHHVTDGGPPVPALGVGEREPLPDEAGHVEGRVDAGIVLGAHDLWARLAPRRVHVAGGGEGGDFRHLDRGRGAGRGEVGDELAVFEQDGVIGPVVHVHGDGVDAFGGEDGGQPGGVLDQGLRGDLAGFVAHDFDLGSRGVLEGGAELVEDCGSVRGLDGHAFLGASVEVVVRLVHGGDVVDTNVLFGKVCENFGNVIHECWDRLGDEACTAWFLLCSQSSRHGICKGGDGGHTSLLGCFEEVDASLVTKPVVGAVAEHE